MRTSVYKLVSVADGKMAAASAAAGYRQIELGRERCMISLSGCGTGEAAGRTLSERTAR